MFVSNRLCVLLLLLSFGVATPASAAVEVFYCADDDRVGFEPTEQYEMGRYNPQRFIIKVDFQTDNIISEKLYFEKHNKTVCMKTPIPEDVLYCQNWLGTSFAFNKTTLKYHLANVFLQDAPSDTIILSHGSCEKF